MSATPTPLSLREARQREAEAEDVATKNYALVNATDYERLLAARRATDEALVRAVMEYVTYWGLARDRGGVASYDGNGDTIDPAGVLDAVEREETER